MDFLPKLCEIVLMKRPRVLLSKISAILAGAWMWAGVGDAQNLENTQLSTKSHQMSRGSQILVSIPISENGISGSEIEFRDVGVGAVYFAKTEVTRSQWRAFVGSGGEDVKPPHFQQGAGHPVVGITLDKAKAFCSWLTRVGRAGGSLTAEQTCRLPTNKEWSKVGGLLYAFDGAPPLERQLESETRFGWGDRWPPKRGTANLAEILEGGDGWSHTSPVGSFDVTGSDGINGIVDLVGNVWEWTDDGRAGETGTLRGGSFTSFRKDEILVAYEYEVPREFTAISFGFRPVVEDLGLARVRAKSQVADVREEGQRVRDQFLPPESANDDENLGEILTGAPEMVAVAGRGFQIGKKEVSVREFLEFIAAEKIEWVGRPRFRQSADEAAVGVSKAEAEGYCRWLTGQFAPAGWEYRLPTNDEWSLVAQGAGAQKFIWGDTWPPPADSGNFEATKIQGYYDGFSYTSPTDSFAAAPSGCFGLAGNATEWVSDRDGGNAIARGGSWADWEPDKLARDSTRKISGGKASSITGFRPVLASIAMREVER